MYPIALAIIVFWAYQYILDTGYDIFNLLSQIALSYFSIVYIIKTIVNKADPDFFKRSWFDFAAIIISFIFFSHPLVFQTYIIIRQVVLFFTKLISSQPAVTIFTRFRNQPAKIILISFLITILFGTILLSLPFASSTGESIGFINALFTSTSATCVTGLIVLDTGSAFSLFGKVIIFILMQIGGLGIMTFSSALILFFYKQISFGGQALMKGVIGEGTRENMFHLLRGIVITTLTFEVIGAFLLFIKFRAVLPDTTSAVAYSFFHSVSAFCNAGFCLYPDSFIRFQSSWLVNIVMMALIISGGLGFGVLIDIKKNGLRRHGLKYLSLHSKIVLTFTAGLILGGALLIYVFEYGNLYQDLPFKNGFLASLFQSVTARTAGFNTIPISEVGYATIPALITLMFIGASPGSTGGGVKTTTFAVLVLSIWSLIRGRDDVEIFNRSISQDIIKRVIALVGIALGILITLIIVLCLSEEAPFEDIIFEAFSAFGTVGLSRGLTPHLTSVGKIAIIILMYLGRVGPLTIGFALSERKKKMYYHYTKEEIAIG
ncbi:MAG: TrkH family potassium uptake protein [Candidatus Cloacimonadia bacterium]